MLVENNTMLKYKLYNFDYIEKNHKNFIDGAILANARFEHNFPNRSSTWFYRYYNAMTLSAGSVYYWHLFKKMSSIIREYVGHEEPLWLQCWLNWHTKESLLDWHDHKECVFHGYVSIDPKNTITEFENFKIENKIGNIYIGPAYLIHRVISIEDFDSPRITLGYDVFDQTCITKIYANYGKVDINIGMIPI